MYRPLYNRLTDWLHQMMNLTVVMTLVATGGASGQGIARQLSGARQKSAEAQTRKNAPLLSADETREAWVRLPMFAAPALSDLSPVGMTVIIYEGNEPGREL